MRRSEGALDQIARAGGGLVEAIPEVTTGRHAHGRFLFTATVELFEDYGFTSATPGRQARLDRDEARARRRVRGWPILD